MRKILALLVLILLGNTSARAQTVTAGATSTVLTQAQRDAVSHFWPDGNQGAFFLSGTNYVVSGNPTLAVTINDLNDWTTGFTKINTTTNLTTGPAGAFDQNYAAVQAVYRDPGTGILIGMYHGEFWYNPPSGSPFYAGLGLAYSTDLAVTWHKLGQVLSPQTLRTGSCQSEIGAGTLLVVGSFFYAYFTDQATGCNGQLYLTVARATISSVIAAAQAGTSFTANCPTATPGTLFMKYTGGGTWNGNGVNDLCTPANGGGASTSLTGSFVLAANVKFDSFINRYVLAYSNGFQALQVNLSSDGLAWGTPTTIATTTDFSLLYPTLLNTSGGGADPNLLGQNFFVYYTDTVSTAWTTTSVKRIALTAAPAPGTPAISSLSVNTGPAGTPVTITGTNFGATQGTSTVTFNGTVGTPTSWSATSIAVPVPSGATTGNVVVTVGGIPSNGVVFTVSGGGGGGPSPAFVYTSLAGLPIGVVPSLPAMQSSAVRCPQDIGNGWTGGSRNNITITNPTAMPQFNAFTLSCGMAAGGVDSQALTLTTVSGTCSGCGAQYFFPADAARTSLSFGLSYCMDFDQATFGGQYSNADIVVSGSTPANIAIGGTAGAFLELEVPGGAGNNTNAAVYHGGSCTTDPNAWRWITVGTTNTTAQMNTYDVTGTVLLGHSFGTVTATVSGSGAYGIGISGGEAEFPGGHIYWGNLLFDQVNGTFPLLPPAAVIPQLWSGMIAPVRASNAWATDGVVGGIPSAGWIQSGSTIAAGASTATIQAALNTCAGTNKFVLLGPGSFVITTTLNIPGGCELRGSGPNSTFITTNFASGFAAFHITGASVGSFNQWTSGYAQGNKQLIVSSVSGCTVGSCAVIVDQCENNWSDDSCATGASQDNGNYNNCTTDPSLTNQCGKQPPGGGAEGPDGSYISKRYQAAIFLVTAINQNGCGATCITIDRGLDEPNWSAARTPHATFFTPIQFAGVSNLAADTLQAGWDPNGSGAVLISHGCNNWIHNVKLTHAPNSSTGMTYTCHNTVDNSYIALSNASGHQLSYHAITEVNSTGNLTQNNILQGFTNANSTEGFQEGSVIAYNYVTANSPPNGNTGNSYHAHSGGDTHTLYEGNIGINIQSDTTHGFQPGKSEYRNAMWAVDSCANSQCGTQTSKSFFDLALSLADGARYHNYMFNVWGTPGVTLQYFNGSADQVIYSFSTFDPLVTSTRASWGNYDTVSAKSLFCASGHTNFASCPNGDETGQAATVYPNPVPVVGDTGVGQPAAPPSWYLSSKPTFFGSSIPWPAIGPDVTGGNVGQCSGTINSISGGYAALAALSNAQCGNHGITLNSWGGHVNAIPAMACALNIMGIPPDGVGPGGLSVFPFDPVACGYVSGGGGAPAVSFSPAFINFGSQPVTVPSGQQSVTMTNTGTATLTISSVVVTGANAAQFALVTPSGTDCRTVGSVPAGSTCVFSVVFTPSAVQAFSAAVTFTDSASTSPQSVPLSGSGSQLNAPAPSFAFTGRVEFMGRQFFY